ncbi:hypothetical protein FAM09_07085 [Niastella caeni]|uniref:DUF6538 domain-containing protein n=1 Tax=Niastella caeni TaxID=2569763 RepID=A0A4S8I1D2_9BACT|nr:DUF6538 domain-containing protein [Niastella caeni]THU41857.1 hypothetical protein FAM09_07085 [Niastella caeni]
MDYLLSRKGNYYYNRRVPKTFKKYDPRSRVRISLNTDSRRLARQLAVEKNAQLEAYWISLLHTGEKHNESKYKALVDRAQILGFTYCHNSLLALQPLKEIVSRYQFLEQQKLNEKHVEAVLGSEEKPLIRLEDILPKFYELSKEKLIDKSPDQIRKWKNPRALALKNFINCIGNKVLTELTRLDIVAFKNWWIDLIDNENYVSNTANKQLVNVKTIVTTVADHYNLDINAEHIFKKLEIKRDDARKRPPFSTQFILDRLLVPENLKGLNVQARNALYAFSETGACIAELVGLLPEDIRLNAEIPHIVIVSRKYTSQKTKYRRREIPLVGFALDAFKECPNGFTDYVGKPDTLSATLNSYLRGNNLFPTEDHTVYSLRHSFQDRLLASKALDREQADLMGHKFERPDYGVGVTLAQKLECLEKIRIKSE